MIKMVLNLRLMVLNLTQMRLSQAGGIKYSWSGIKSAWCGIKICRLVFNLPEMVLKLSINLPNGMESPNPVWAGWREEFDPGW